MNSHIALIIAALVGGALIAAQGPIYARMALAFESGLTASLIAFAIATITLVFLVIVMRAPFPNPSSLRAAPSWVWLGAFVGVYQVLVSIAAVPRLGVGNFILIVVFGQIVASQFYDQFGWFELQQRSISVKSLLGIGLMTLGLVLVVWR